MKIIDLSLPHENFASEPYPPEIVYFDHAAGARRIAKLAKVEPADFPDSLGLASERVTSSTHSGTHVDAPWHYGPMCEGKPSRTIDKIPLEWCYGPGVILDMRHKEPGSEITVQDLRQALEKIGYTLKPGDIVLLQTGADKYWGTSKYVDMQSGLGVEGTAWLLDQGIRCIGIDAWGLDRPVSKMGESYRSGDKYALWPSHMYGRKREYLQIEKLANLDQVPRPFGFIVSAFPIKIANGSAGWCRAVAIVPD
ncbi:MAG: cyclase family protein [Bacillota bacterium]